MPWRRDGKGVRIGEATGKKKGLGGRPGNPNEIDGGVGRRGVEDGRTAD